MQRLVNLLDGGAEPASGHAQEWGSSPIPQRRGRQRAVPREQRELDAESERTKGLILAKGVEMEDYRKQSVQLDATIRGYEARIESTPVGIREYDELVRDRDLAKKDYEDLDRRVNSSAMSTALQNRQQGERLEQLDPPSLPQTPARPKRLLMVAVGTSLG